MPGLLDPQAAGPLAVDGSKPIGNMQSIFADMTPEHPDHHSSDARTPSIAKGPEHGTPL